MYGRIQADNFFNTTIASLINDIDASGTFSVSNKTVNGYTLEDGTYIFWMVVGLSNQNELEIFRITNVSGTTLTFDRRISPNGLYNHAIGQVCVMTVSSDYCNWLSNNTNDFGYTETITGTGNELKVKVYGGRVENPSDSDVVVADTILTLTNNTTNYIYFDDTDNTFKSGVSEPETYKVLASVVTSGGSITTITDLRAIKAILGAVPLSLSTADRTALTNVRPGTIIYDTNLSENYQFISGNWYPISAGSTQPNASETVAGKVEIATAAEVLAGTETGGTGAILSVSPKELKDNYKAGNGLKKTTTDFEVDTTDTDIFVKTSSGAADENKVPILNANGQLADGFISDTFKNNIQSFVLGEDISSSQIVSLMPDGKVYKLSNNKRLLSNGTITGHSATTSCLLPNNKIATLGITTNTLTLYIGTIDLATNLITYGAGVQVTTNAMKIGFLDKAGTDSLVIGYQTTGYIGVARGVSISGTVPTIGNETTVVLNGHTNASMFPGDINWVRYVADGKVAIARYQGYDGGTSASSTIYSISGTTIVAGGGAGGSSNGGINVSMQYVSNNTYFLLNRNTNNSACYAQLITVSGTTPTLGSNINIGNVAGNGACSDGTYIYVLSGGTGLRKYSYSGNTLTQIYSTTVDSGSSICVIGGLIGIVSSTSLIRYSDNSTGVTKLNTIDYSVSLANLQENANSNNYCIFTVSGNPSYIYKISNESVFVIGYSPSGNLNETKTVTINGGIITGLTNIIPGRTYWAKISNGILDTMTGVCRFAKGLTTTTAKVNIVSID